MNSLPKNVVEISSYLIDSYLEPGHIALDATLGNGNDSYKICEKISDQGKLYAFDIQEIALENSREKLKNFIDRDYNIELILDSHENIDLYIKEKLDFIIYNLGYLPRADKTIRTNKNTTINSLKKSLNLLGKNGIILINSYIGHDGGLEEYREVNIFLSNLNQKEFKVMHLEFVNQINNPPKLFIVEKL